MPPEETAEEKAAREAQEEKARVDAEAAAKKAAANGNGNADDSDDLESKWDPKTKAYIEKLRKEAATNRADKKSLNERLTKLESGLKSALGVDDKTTPEQQIENLKTQTEAEKFKAAVLEAAIDHGISKDQKDYFQFLIEKQASQLADGEEISDEQMTEIVKKVKLASGGGSGNGGNTSVNDKNKPNPDGGKNYDGLSVEQFARMSILEKSQMYEKFPDKYSSLMSQAKEKRLI